MSEIKFPLVWSVAGHTVCLVLLVLLMPTKIPPVPPPLATGGIEVAFEPSLPRPEEPPAQVETLPPQVEPPPPEPEPVPPRDEPVVATEPPPPAPEAPVPMAEPPPVPRKPAVKPSPKPVQPRSEKAQPAAVAPPQPAPAVVAAPQTQTAYAPTPVTAPVPSAEVSPGYRALLSAWLESHKRYPDSARQRGEEGRAVLRFAVDRSGRVVDFTVAQSSGYPDLDSSIQEMMRGATLPPFPTSMTQPRIDVSVTIRFSLSR